MNKYRFFFAIFLLFYLVTAFCSLNTLFVYTPDSARYVAWAQSLAQGNGFTDATEPEPVRYCIHSPLYSLLLAPIAFFFPHNVVILKVINVILASGIAVLLFVLVRNKTNELVALIVTTMFLFHPWTYFLSTQLLTEILFGFGLISLLYWIGREQEISSQKYIFYAVVASLVVCIFSREVGILLFPLVVGFYVLRKEYTKAIIVFFLPLILYIAWYIRNEIYYAGIEATQFKNSTLFFTNVLAPVDASFIEELRMRIITNVAYYFKEFRALFFYASYNVFDDSLYSPWISTIDVMMPFTAMVTFAIKTLHWLLAVVSFLLIGWGIFLDYKQRVMFYFKVIFLCLYLPVIFIYPVFDARFLFPIFLIGLLWIGFAISSALQLNIRFRKTVIFSSIILLSIPNVAWCFNYFLTQYQLKNDPKGTFIEKRYPKIAFGQSGHVQLTLPLAAEWINAQSDSSTVVLTPYKELRFFLKDKVVKVIPGFASVSTFNQILRDYEIQYLVQMRDRTEWRDYEYQMGMSELYSFELLHTAGCFEVYKVLPKTAESEPQRLEGIIRKIRDEKYLSVDSFFVRNKIVVASNPKLMLLNIINKHFMEQLDSARMLMQYLYGLPQGLMFSRQATLHQTTIDRRMQLDKKLSFQERADILMTVGLNYWELGMKKFALRFSRECIEVDSSYALAYAYNIMFDLQTGDTVHAFAVHKKLQRNFPNTEFTSVIDTLMFTYKRLNKATSIKDKALALQKLGLIYFTLRIPDMAIDCNHRALQLDPGAIDAYKTLVKMYEHQRIFYPAFIFAKRYLAYVPDDSTMIASVANLREKLYMVAE